MSLVSGLRFLLFALVLLCSIECSFWRQRFVFSRPKNGGIFMTAAFKQPLRNLLMIKDKESQGSALARSQGLDVVLDGDLELEITPITSPKQAQDDGIYFSYRDQAFKLNVDLHNLMESSELFEHFYAPVWKVLMKLQEKVGAKNMTLVLKHGKNYKAVGSDRSIQHALKWIEGDNSYIIANDPIDEEKEQEELAQMLALLNEAIAEAGKAYDDSIENDDYENDFKLLVKESKNDAGFISDIDEDESEEKFESEPDSFFDENDDNMLSLLFNESVKEGEHIEKQSESESESEPEHESFTSESDEEEDQDEEETQFIENPTVKLISKPLRVVAVRKPTIRKWTETPVDPASECCESEGSIQESEEEAESDLGDDAHSYGFEETKSHEANDFDAGSDNEETEFDQDNNSRPAVIQSEPAADEYHDEHADNEDENLGLDDEQSEHTDTEEAVEIVIVPNATAEPEIKNNGETESQSTSSEDSSSESSSISDDESSSSIESSDEESEEESKKKEEITAEKTKKQGINNSTPTTARIPNIKINESIKTSAKVDSNVVTVKASNKSWIYWIIGSVSGVVVLSVAGFFGYKIYQMKQIEYADL